MCIRGCTDQEHRGTMGGGEEDEKVALNVNVGILGHVDSGKTSLARALSTRLSTASLDKHPQSRERGITLDLGFSSFMLPLPAQLRELYVNGGTGGGEEGAGDANLKMQVTLVDCPGHASLIRTVLGGASIIDLMLLVIDATKGIQTQTAECLVVGEVTTDNLVIVLNKTDLFPVEKREEMVRRVSGKLRTVMKGTRFPDCAIIPLAAAPGASESAEPIGTELLLDHLASGIKKRDLKASQRTNAGDEFLFAVDHCFPLRGQGTVLTGTVLHGGARVGDTLELPQLGVTKAIKSMQMFHRPAQACTKGDRVGIRVTQLDAAQIERGLACSPGYVVHVSAVVARVRPIRFFKGDVATKSKLHITAGHATVMATCEFFGTDPTLDASLAGLDLDGNGRGADGGRAGRVAPFVPGAAYRHYEGLGKIGGVDGDGGAEEGEEDADGGKAEGPATVSEECLALLRFEHAILLPRTDREGGAEATLLIGSKLDTDTVHGAGTGCRLAFSGRVDCCFGGSGADEEIKAQVRVYKWKSRRGTVDRVEDEDTLIAKGLFKKETNVDAFVGMSVTCSSTGAKGKIDATFGKTGKVRCRFGGGHGLAPDKAKNSTLPRTSPILLQFRRFAHDKRMVQ